MVIRKRVLYVRCFGRCRSLVATAVLGLVVVLSVAGFVIQGCGDSDSPADEGCTAEGKLEGVCGLEGKCVDCNVDSDCQGGVCTISGSCIAPSNCISNSDCPQGLECHDGICTTGCSEDSECGTGSVCNGGYCYNARCDKDGNCPTGRVPSTDSLECIYQGG